MSLLCKLFGHRTVGDLYGGAEYMKISNTYPDNTGRVHAWLKYRCPRCHEKVEGGKTHLPYVPKKIIDIVFDGPPKTGKFVDTEDAKGNSIKLGDWFQRSDGYWVLRIRYEER